MGSVPPFPGNPQELRAESRPHGAPRGIADLPGAKKSVRQREAADHD